ncbi:MAG: hypothetical protein GQ582_04205 [Methyloprofundus sp.]|nr:hypothetical protein [Methyloprofundus sp.]
MLTYIVVDTSYWLELFKVPRHYKNEHHQKIKQHFDVATKNTFRFYLPIPVLFELANHIAHVDNGFERQGLAQKFSSIVSKGIDINEPLFNVIPCMAFPVAMDLKENLNFFVDRFEMEFSPQGLGFTDSSIILEAESLKEETNIVHIWTLDQALKAREPDTESNAFIGVHK